MADIPHPQLDQIAGTQFAVYRQVEQSEFPTPIGELQTQANGSDLFQLEGCLLSDNLALVPGRLSG
jgi:hypothetical protein